MTEISDDRRRLSRLDRLLLAGRDPDRVINMVDHVRFQYAAAIAAGIMVLFIGYLGQVQRDYAHSKCLERNAAAAAGQKILTQLVAASKADGDRNVAAVWKSYFTDAGKMPKC